MKRLLCILGMLVVLSGFGWTQQSAKPQSSLMLVSSKHPRRVRHHAHKAGKHHRPKHHHTASAQPLVSRAVLAALQHPVLGGGSAWDYAPGFDEAATPSLRSRSRACRASLECG